MCALVFVTCVVSLALPRILHTDVLVWPVNAIVIALTLNEARDRFVPLVLAAWVGDAAASLVSGEPLLMAAILSGCNMAAVAVCWLGVRRFVGSSDRIFESRGFWRFLVIAGGAAPLVSSSIAAVALGGLERVRTWIMLGEWTIANGLGAVVFVPITLVATSVRRRLAATPLTPRAVGALVTLAVVASAVFALDDRCAFLLFPLFLLVVFEAEVLGAAAGSLLIILTGVGAELVRRSLLGHDRAISDADMVLAQGFIAAITLVGLPIATTLEQRRTLRARLAESEENYRSLTEASEDLITRIDLDGTITFASRAGGSFGYGRGALVGRRFEDIVFPEDRSRVADFLAALQTRPAAETAAEQIEFRLIDPAGEARWVEAKAGVIANTRGEAVAVVKVLRDVTRRKIYESELAAARSESEAAARIKAEFLANMSHELRTPLTSVIGFTRLVLREPGLSDRAVEYLNKAANAGSLLLSIINDVLDYSKIEAGHVTLNPQATAARGVIERTADLFVVPAADKGLSLRAEVDIPPAAEILMDQDRVTQVLLNLVANAVKFSSRGEVRIGARWSPEDPVLRVEVEDQGPGIAPQDQDKLFKRFSQLNQTDRPSVGGTGLGLAICNGLVMAMGGRIGVVSDEGRGSRFWFEVPAPAATGAAAASDAEGEVDLAGMNILIVDDHRENRELVRAILVPFGAMVTEAAGGEQAVQVARARSFDLILMDLLMPGTDGAEAMRRIRRVPGPNQAAPIVAFSAGLDAASGDRNALDGFDDGLSKPILPAELLRLALKYAPDEVPAR